MDPRVPERNRRCGELHLSALACPYQNGNLLAARVLRYGDGNPADRTRLAGEAQGLIE
jgi:hypothetical protein